MKTLLLALLLYLQCSGIHALTLSNEVLFAKAQLAHASEDWIQSLHYLNTILEDQGDYVEAQLLRAKIYSEQGNNSSASRSYKSLLAKQLRLDKKNNIVSEKTLELSFQLASTYFATYTSFKAHEYAKNKVKKQMIHLFKSLTQQV